MRMLLAFVVTIFPFYTLATPSEGNRLDALEAENAALRAQLRSSRRSLQFAYSEDPTEMEGCTEDELYDFEHEIMVVQNALYMYNSTTLEADKSLIFHTAQVGGLAYLDSFQEMYNDQEFTMETVKTLTMVDFMQGDIFKLPTTSNEASDVDFVLPEVTNGGTSDAPFFSTSSVSYTDPSSLVYMPILDMAALIQAGAVSCVTVVQTFIDRIKEFEPYLAITSLLLEESALAMAAEYDAAIAENGTFISPLQCIPFGMKDHHSIFGDEYTRDGNILYGYQTKPTTSSLVGAYMKAGAIPIAKFQMGSWANGPLHGWGKCLSPYLSGSGGGSSCGSGSAAAIGAVPFAISEETWGSIVSPARENSISGHLTSYGVFSRGGATILSPTMDHFGFHSRWIKDYGLLVNYGRTGEDPLDSDSRSYEFINPDDVDPSSIRVLIVTGDGQIVYDETSGEWTWNDAVPRQGKLGLKWAERMQLVMEALDSAGISYDTVDYADSAALWTVLQDDLFSSWPNDADGNNQYNAIYYGTFSGTAWAKISQFFLGHDNSHRRNRFGFRQLPFRLWRNVQWAYIKFGRLLFNDPLWKTYDVVITSDPYAVTQNHHSALEQWLRTAKTFVTDYYQATPCLHSTNGTIEGAFMTLTSLPFKDHLNFVVGTAIQEYEPIKSKIMFPNEAAIKEALDGRTRCPYAYFDDLGIKDWCPAPNETGSPMNYLNPSSYGMIRGCVPGHEAQHIPDAWATSPYVPAYELDEIVPDEAIWHWEDYGPVACTHVCPWVPSLCEGKGIVCDSRRLAEEKEILKTANLPENRFKNRELTADEIRRLEAESTQDL